MSDDEEGDNGNGYGDASTMVMPELAKIVNYNVWG